MNKYKILLLIFFIVIAVAITVYHLMSNYIPSDIRKVLKMAGNNKTELLKVINHYKKNKESEKLEATYYLIRNMPGKVSIIYNLDTLDSLNLNNNINTNVITTKYDINYITSKYLISEIDLSYYNWKKYTWCQKLSFDDYCKKLLPYRLLSEELTNWREYYYKKHRHELDSLNSLGANQRDVCFFINNKYKKKYIQSADILPTSIKYQQIENIGGGTCGHLAYNAVLELRACGVPLNYDVVLKHGRINGGHVYNSLDSSYSNPSFLFFSPYEREQERNDWRSHKIVRIEYEIRNSDILNKERKENIPEEIIQSSFYTDVTSSYFPMKRVNFRITYNNNYNIVYLCTYNRGDFYAFNWSEIKNDSAVFHELTAELLYFPMVYRDNEFIPVSCPFILRESGSIDFLNISNEKRSIKNIKVYAVKRDITNIDKTYTLYYWDKKWERAGDNKPDSNLNSLSFNEVPAGTLYKVYSEGFDEKIQRPFSYIDEKIEFW